MKTTVRAAVIVLALTGAAASNHIETTSASGATILSKVSAMPVPMCPLNDPHHCHIDGNLR